MNVMTKQELELLELVTMHISEYGWEKDEFLIFIDYEDIEDITSRLSDIFGNKIFNDFDIKAILRDGYLVIDLVEALGGYDEVYIEDVFDREKYQH